MEHFDIKKVIHMLESILTCPICNKQYGGGQSEVIHSEQNEALSKIVVFIHSECGKCKGSIIFSVEIQGPTIRSVGVVTDLTSFDTSKFKNRQPLTADEIINMHQILKDFNGNLLEQ